MRIVQVVSALAHADYYDQAAQWETLFQNWGYDTDLYFFEDLDEDSVVETQLSDEDIVIIHFTCQPIPELILKHPDEKTAVVLLDYIPTEQHKYYAPEIEQSLCEAENSLLNRLQHCELAIGHCEAGLDRLEQLGAFRIRKIPFLLDYNKLDEEGDSFQQAMLPTDLILGCFVGDIDIDSKAEDLITSFWMMQTFDNKDATDAQLWLSGNFHQCNGEMAKVQNIIKRYKIPENFLVFADELEPDQELSLLKEMNFYFTLDAGDLTGSTILKSIYLDKLVVAKSVGAAPDVLGAAETLLVNPLHSTISEVISNILHDQERLHRAIKQQKSRLELFDPATIAYVLRSFIGRFESS